MELRITTDLSKLPDRIHFNSDELKNELAQRLDYYNNLVVTEDSIKAAKNDRAALNKLKTAIEDKRKEIKKICLVPYESFEKQCAEIVGMINAPIASIDTQLKTFEDIRKEQKYNELQAFFNEINKLDFVKFEDVLNPKWGNTGMKTDALKSEISDSVALIFNDFEEIKKLYSESTLFTAIIGKYKETLSKSKTLVYATMLEAEQKKEQERKVKAEQAEQEKTEIKPPVEQTVQTPQVTLESDPYVSGCFAISCKKTQLIALKRFMNENGITVIGTMTIAEFRNYKESKEEE